MVVAVTARQHVIARGALQVQALGAPGAMTARAVAPTMARRQGAAARAAATRAATQQIIVGAGAARVFVFGLGFLSHDAPPPEYRCFRRQIPNSIIM